MSRTKQNLSLLATAFASLVLAAGALAPAGQAAATSSAQGSSVHPDSATGCSTDPTDEHTSCISVNGSGLHVDSVGAREDIGYGAGTCASPTLYENGDAIFYGSQQCGSYTVSYTFPENESFPNGTQLCIQWSNINLRPCETVHS